MNRDEKIHGARIAIRELRDSLSGLLSPEAIDEMVIEMLDSKNLPADVRAAILA